MTVTSRERDHVVAVSTINPSVDTGTARQRAALDIALVTAGRPHCAGRT